MILKAGRNEKVCKDFNVYYDKHIIDAWTLAYISLTMTLSKIKDITW